MSVSLATSSICSIDAGNTVSFNSVGTCTLFGDQGGDPATYNPAPRATQNITVASLAAGSSPTLLFNCPSAFYCGRNLTGLTENQLQAENVFSGTGEDACANNCSLTPQLPWLTVCNRDSVSCRFSFNSRRVANLDILVTNLTSFLGQCVTSFCTSAVNTSLVQYSSLARSAAVVCTDAVCQKYKDKSASAQRVWQGTAGAVQRELQRLDAEMVDESMVNLFSQTLQYFNCTTDSCRSEWAQRTNVSFAIHGYIRIAKTRGLTIANATAWKSLFDQIDTRYMPCALSSCNGRNFSTLRNDKRSLFAAMIFVKARLDELAQNCSGACDSTSLIAARSQTDIALYQSSNYLPSAINIAGIVIYTLIIICCAIVFALAVMWEVKKEKNFMICRVFFFFFIYFFFFQAYHGKGFFMLVLLLIFLAATFRVAFFGAATASGDVQKQYLTYVILDKLGLLFFCFALLVFCAMWSRAINIMAGDSSTTAVVILITAACFVAAIFAIVVYFAVVVSVTYISLYYYEFVTDYADIILACVTLALALSLLIQILFVMTKLKDDEEKLRNIRIIAGWLRKCTAGVFLLC